MIVGSDLEWGKDGIDVLGLAWNNGLSATATARDNRMGDYLRILQNAETVVGQNYLDADCRQLAKEAKITPERADGSDVSGMLL